MAAALDEVDEFRSAQELHDMLKHRGDSVGLTTVYRTLQSLADAGEVDVLRTTEGESVYRRCSTGDHHHHLVCRVCGKAVEVEGPAVEKWAERSRREHGFVNVAHTVEIFGTCADCAECPTVKAVAALLDHADSVRRMGVRANADTPEDATRARRFGAGGIGLCRTEHMFLGDRRVLVENLVLADDEKGRNAALAEMLPRQREDFVEILAAMDGLPVTIRLIDPPLHEFLPDLTALSVRVERADERGEDDTGDHRLLAAVRALHEQNPMLGLRGVRLGVVVPGLVAMQARAVLEAAADRIDAGGDPRPEIMVPLVSTVAELAHVRRGLEQVAAEVEAERGFAVPHSIGTMIEVPRAALTADLIATEADFFSFGTNDLTQMTWGFSRDDVEAAFFPAYLDLGILSVSPFETLDAVGVGALVAAAVAKGRAAKPDLHLGICGEHGGDPDSIHFFESVGLDYLSCSPFRIPVARLEAARAALD